MPMSMRNVFRYHLLDQFRKDAESLLKLHVSQFGDDEEENDSDDLEEALQVCEDSIALKEKHRGKNSFYNILFQDPSFKSEKPNRTSKSKFQGEPSVSNTFSKEARERNNFHTKPKDSFLKSANLKIKSEDIEEKLQNTNNNNLPKEQIRDEKIINSSILSPLYNCFSNNNNCSRLHKYDSKINIPDITCDLEISPPSTASSIAESIAIIEEDSDNDDKEVLSPIGVPCAGTMSMSKVSTRKSMRLTPLLLQNTSDRPKSSQEGVNIEENAQEICDILTGDSTENFHSNKLGLLKCWQNTDCSSDKVCNSNFKESSDLEIIEPSKYYFPSIFSTSPGTVPSQLSSQKDHISDLYFGNQVDKDNLSRWPLYRRFSKFGKCTPETTPTSPLNSSNKINNNHRGKLNNVATSWGSSSPADSRISKEDENSNCDHVLNIQPLTGTLYNFVSGKTPIINSSFMNSRMTLNPLRFRNDEESKKLADEIKNLYSISVEGDHKIQVNTTKLENLPAIIDKKRMRCGQCNKKLNITNMYNCRCGGIFCAQHRYSEVHACNYDYKTEGRKLLQQQNPVIVADKLNKL